MAFIVPECHPHPTPWGMFPFQLSILPPAFSNPFLQGLDRLSCSHVLRADDNTSAESFIFGRKK